MPTNIVAVLFGSSPAEVVKAAIGFDSVKVAAFHTFGARADEGFEDKAVDCKCCVWTTRRRC